MDRVLPLHGNRRPEIKLVCNAVDTGTEAEYRLRLAVPQCDTWTCVRRASRCGGVHAGCCDGSRGLSLHGLHSVILE